MTQRRTASARQRPPSKKRRASAALWNTDDEDEDEGGGVVELPLSAYEQQRKEKIANNQETLDQIDARLDMTEVPRATDGAPKQPKKRCESKPLHALASVPL